MNHMVVPVLPTFYLGRPISEPLPSFPRPSELGTTRDILVVTRTASRMFPCPSGLGTIGTIGTTLAI